MPQSPSRASQASKASKPAQAPDTPPEDHEDPEDSGRYYITTSIPYVNARPHVGHGLEYVLTDALARYHRQIGQDTYFLTGSDENSLKNVQSAEKEGIPVQDLVARNAAQFLELKDLLDLSFDDFIRTSTDPRHIAGVRKLWEACDANGDIYTKTYRGLYCVGCEQFYTPEELVNGLCPEGHLPPPEEVEEENYFFRLSKYGDQLIELIESEQLRILPLTRRNEVLSFIRMGLEDFSISRSQRRAHGWGIPVPGDPSQVMYVWFDALGNYITALGYADDGPLYERYWVHNPHRVHVIGKGITRFHAIYWPAMLLSAKVPLPREVLVHGYVTVNGQKMSKSLGNVLDPAWLAREYGTDPLRYYLLRGVPTVEDGDFNTERLVRIYNSELADKLGNLLNRVVSMIGRYFGGVVPAPGTAEGPDEGLVALNAGLPARIDAAMNRFAPGEALDVIWELVEATNKYVGATEPWVLAKRRKTEPEAEARLATVLYNPIEALRLIATYCLPFIPGTAHAIAAQLGIALDETQPWAERTRWGGYRVGTTLQPGGVLFPKRELPTASEAPGETPSESPSAAR